MDIKDKTIEIECGTALLKDINFKISDYGKFAGTNASVAAQGMALSLLMSTMDDPDFADDGCRNNGAVNLSIALHVLGCKSPEQWLRDFFEAHGDQFHTMDMDLMIEHMQRVGDYLWSWGPAGDEGSAIKYMLD